MTELQLKPDPEIRAREFRIGAIGAGMIMAECHLAAYAEAGIPEYLVWRTMERGIDCFELRDGRYVPSPVEPDQPWRSRVFPGLWLDRDALLDGDGAKMLEGLQAGLASAEHRAFAERLRA